MCGFYAQADIMLLRYHCYGTSPYSKHSNSRFTTSIFITVTNFRDLWKSVWFYSEMICYHLLYGWNILLLPWPRSSPLEPRWDPREITFESEWWLLLPILGNSDPLWLRKPRQKWTIGFLWFWMVSLLSTDNIAAIQVVTLSAIFL
jgi:hypothetical protein